MAEPQNQHVLPASELHLHDTEDAGQNCTCGPEVYTSCDECGEATGGFSENCWKCGGDGLLEVRPGDLPPFVILHGFVNSPVEPYRG